METYSSEINQFYFSPLFRSRLTLFRMGILGAAHRWGRGEGGKKPPSLKSVTDIPTMMKLATVIPYLKKIQKIDESRDTPPGLC